MTLQNSTFQAPPQLLVYRRSSSLRELPTTCCSLTSCSLSSSPVKSGRALSSTRSRGLTCCCSRRFLAAVREVKISCSAMSKPSPVSRSSRSLLLSLVVLVTNLTVTGALRSLEGDRGGNWAQAAPVLTALLLSGAKNRPERLQVKREHWCHIKSRVMWNRQRELHLPDQDKSSSPPLPRPPQKFLRKTVIPTPSSQPARL